MNPSRSEGAAQLTGCNPKLGPAINDDQAKGKAVYYLCALQGAT